MYQKHEEWWPQVRIAVRAYKRRKKQKTMPPRNRQEVEAVEKALEWLKEQEDGEAQTEMINLYHIKQTHELRGAADQVGYSYAAAVMKNREFMKQVAINLGYETRKKESKGKRKAVGEGKKKRKSG